jgi:phosphoribosylamine--glycine ligase
MVGDPVECAKKLRPDLVVVGPEQPLCDGLVDELTALGFVCYGPSKAAARLEASKPFMKEFAERHGIRTARHRTITRIDSLAAALKGFDSPPVVKAGGLCAGKGVVVAESFEEAERAARQMLSGETFGVAGQQVVLEERLVGQEVSVHAICDGERAFVLPAIQDHKRIGEGDTGPNTGGMGTYGPAAVVDTPLARRIETEVVERVLEGMSADGSPFVGTLFAGLMITDDGEPMLLEINVRFGDPETQVLVDLIDGDFARLLQSAAQGQLDPSSVSLRPGFGMCVVLASAGYPASARKGDVITGLSAAAALDGVNVYHAGTRQDGADVVTAGGRVLGVTATGQTLEQARDRAYKACGRIHFDGMQLRKDIGHRQLRELPTA